MSRLSFAVVSAVLFLGGTIRADEAAAVLPAQNQDFRKRISQYLVETPPESLTLVIKDIWEKNGGETVARTPETGKQVADSIAAGVDIDFQSGQMSWAIKGFSNTNPNDRENLANVLLNACVEEMVADNDKAQILKQKFEIRVPSGNGDDDDMSNDQYPFIVPEGLSMPVDCLLALLGHNANHGLDGVPFPFSVDECVWLAEECFKKRLYIDAVAIATHGIRFEKRPSLIYIRGASQLGLGQADLAAASLRELSSMQQTSSSKQVHELSRINDAIVVRFLLAYRAVKVSPKVNLERQLSVR